MIQLSCWWKYLDASTPNLGIDVARHVAAVVESDGQKHKTGLEKSGEDEQAFQKGILKDARNDQIKQVSTVYHCNKPKGKGRWGTGTKD